MLCLYTDMHNTEHVYVFTFFKSREDLLDNF